MDRVRQILEEHRATLDEVEACGDDILGVGQRFVECLAGGGTIYWLGNGGSAADSQHLAAELVGRYEGVDRRGLAAIALTTDTSVLTSVGNDLGFEAVFARQIEALCRPGDVVVAISTSGNSPNILAAVAAARARSAFTVGLCGGDGGDLARAADIAIVVPSVSPARVQEAHILIGHIWCDQVDEHVRRHDDGQIGTPPG